MLQEGPPDVEEEYIPAGVPPPTAILGTEETVISATRLRAIDATFFARQSIQ